MIEYAYYMSKIHILSEDLVNKIAAGEVIERPASVAKELLDNAYDCGANQITVEIEDGGMKKIRVTDNGTGMDKADIELAFKSHATSKINSTDDLLNIKSYGFRGEALSSIASVSKVTLKSRLSGDSLGNEIKIEGGNVISLQETGTPAGTTVTVEDLFFNIPARKEFIKSSQSEYKAILDIIEAHAIANPKIGLTLINNEKTIYSLPKDHLIEDRVRAILGNDINDKLIPIFFEHPHVEIYGFTGKPELASERKKFQMIFVNKRAIENKSIAFAVKDAYSSLIPKNTYPPYVLFIDVQPNIVDVNVHPRKEEVKFSNEQLIFTSVRTAVKTALDRTNLVPGSENKNPFSNDPFSPNPMASAFGGFNPSSQMPPRSFGSQPRPFARPMSPQKPANSFWDSPFDEATTTFSNRKVYQFHNLYLVTETESGIMIYDQHAVHERILYEKLKNKNAEINKDESVQKLLQPIVINLSAKESVTLEEFSEDLKAQGIEIEEFGPNTYKIIQVPASMASKNVKDIFHEILEDLENDKEIKSADNKTEKILTYLSCRMAYKSGDNIPNEEAAALIDQLEQTEIKYTCPHGRPVKVEITLKELSKMFKRT